MTPQALAKHYASTTQLAIFQDEVFENRRVPTRDDMKKWHPLVSAHLELCGPNNLCIRQRLIEAYVYDTPSSVYAAREQRDALMRNGLWLEGPSYAKYVQTGVDWYTQKTGKSPWDSAAMWQSYRALVGPDGRLPLGETADEDWRQFSPLQDVVDDPAFYCVRWLNIEGKAKLYVLIGLDTETEPRRNLHFHCHGGMVAVWKDGWLSRPTPYTGFNFLESFESRCLRPVLPDGALRPTWRIRPPEITGTRHGSTFRFEWDYGFFSPSIQRTIEVLDWGVKVTDKKGIFGKPQSKEYRA